MREMQNFARAAEFADLSPGTGGSSNPSCARCGSHDRRVRPASLERTETEALAHAPFLELLCGQGCERAATWLEEQANDVGNRSSVNVRKWFG